MARGQKDEGESQKLLDTTQNQIVKLWEKCYSKFMEALEGSEKKRVTVNFGVTLDLSESAPVVDTQISFKDKDKEGGMDVVKSFRHSVTDELEDPKAPPLPGFARNGDEQPATEEAPKKRGRRNAAEANPVAD